MKQRALSVRLRPGGHAAYSIHIAARGSRMLAEYLSRQDRHWLVVTDRNVRRHLWSDVAQALRRAGLSVPAPVVLRAGEGAKSVTQWATLLRALLRHGLDRGSLIVALGGGVVTDVAGFAAATYMRGIDWVAAPTSLLGMVDAAVGGKVGANLLRTKNAIGAFHHPRVVIAGTDWLRTLPERERRSGLGEVVKYAMIANRRLFHELERCAPDAPGRSPMADAKLVARCCRIKARFVELDSQERGIRAALNFGHTFGHAFEGDGRAGLTHGEAVGLGMVAACAVAEELGVAGEPQQERLRALLERLGLPGRLPHRPHVARLRRAWRRDKKARRGVAHLVLTPRIGEVSVGHAVDERLLLRALGVLMPRPAGRRR
ncbi:MAG: 3-dehydroquinate synthase [Candidatus Latescibacterota bacterium]|nr:MAG: 3-dehydroquinate synthase [Candidatus Latescibacterota bacterium]